MNLEIASEVVATYTVASARNLQINAANILPNVRLFYMVCDYGNPPSTSTGYLDHNNTSATVHFSGNGELRMVALLEPKFNNRTTDGQGRPKADFFFGNDDGTGQDFQGTMGADINLKFYDELQQNPPAAYTGTKTSFTIDDNKIWDFLLTSMNINIANDMAGHKSVRIKADVDPNSKAMIEECVWIHLFDNSLGLLGIVDLEQNETCFLDYVGNSFKLGAFVKYPNALMPNDPAGTFTFAIGDPKTDAVVSVSEV